MIAKLNALIPCVKAVWTDPWWNLVGVFAQLLAPDDRASCFDVFVKLGDVEPGRDCRLQVLFGLPDSDDIAAQASATMRAGSDRVAEQVVSFEMLFRREGMYTIEVWLDDVFVDSQVLEVVHTG